MPDVANTFGLSRRHFVRAAGGVLIGFSFADESWFPRVIEAAAEPGCLDAWLRIQSDGSVHVWTGKTEIGMGVETAYAQIVAEELSLSPDRVTLTMGDTAMTPDQGGVGGSTSIAQGASPLRNAAATARAVLVRMGSRRLERPAEDLVVADGFVATRDDSARRVSFGELASSLDQTEALRVSGQGFALNVEGAGKPKDPRTYSIVGSSVPRKDLPPKILGRFEYVTDVRVPAMLHGRVVRPPSAGATFVSVDKGSVEGIAGLVRTVVKGDFVGVVAETEWAAVRAARALKTSWKEAAVFPDQRELYHMMRRATPRVSRQTPSQGDATEALSRAVTTISASYDYPFQSHAPMGPGCAVADVHMDGVTTIWCGAQKPHALQRGLADLLGRPVEKVRVIWVEDAGSYGRPGFEDAAADAAILSEAVGRPVRVQWSRADMTTWGTKGPPVVCDLTAGLDASGAVTAIRFVSRALSGTEIGPVPTTAGNFLAAQLTGIRNARPGDEYAQWGVQTMAYTFPNIDAVAHVLPPFHEMASPLRTTHLRDPGGPATTFAVESFVDELAAAAGVDPVQFRLRYLTDQRAIAVLEAAARATDWIPRSSPNAAAPTGDRVRGRGIAVGIRNGTYASTVAEVEVHVKTGAIRVIRLACAHDCGLIVNPDALKGTISANLVQSLSRALKEEVSFDRRVATAADWSTYPVARARDIPGSVDVVLLNRPDLPSSGAGEASSRPTAAALGNAVFDACRARLRQVPFTAGRVRDALARAQARKAEVHS